MRPAGFRPKPALGSEGALANKLLLPSTYKQQAQTSLHPARCQALSEANVSLSSKPCDNVLPLPSAQLCLCLQMLCVVVSGSTYRQACALAVSDADRQLLQAGQLLLLAMHAGIEHQSLSTH